MDRRSHCEFVSSLRMPSRTPSKTAGNIAPAPNMKYISISPKSLFRQLITNINFHQYRVQSYLKIFSNIYKI